MPILSRAAALLSAALLAGCATPPAAPPPLSAYIVLGEQGAAVARVLTTASSCPALLVDGREQPMRQRAPAETVEQRPTSSAPADSKPSAFPVLTCEATLPAGARSASVAGQALPVPRAEPRRIVVIGDTGCRLKKSDKRYQACNDPQATPFATIAAAAARWQPDLVIHVGDYHYRENPCPEGNAGCAGSPWGYGWDTWREDFFRPAAPLLAAAPWVMVRGNHESCSRAGQGWWRFLDPRPLVPGRDCNAAANDMQGNYSDPYAVPLGGDSQLLVLDTAATTWRGLQPGQPGWDQYRANYRRLDELSQQARWNLGLNHHPILGFGADVDKHGQRYLQLGDAGLQQSFGSLNPMLLPAGVQAMLSGHVHLWQQVSYRSAHPSQFVTGFSGTDEDTTPLPDDVSPIQPAPGAVIDHFSSWVGGFGFMTLERGAQPGEWQAVVHDRNGKEINHCRLAGRASRCELTRVP
ncbi:metallophosphoesterase family protein [Pseudoduganella sp. UC29_106]|uniref:metallophosphoesterase family protein n=1 Tax=Pseudoduganella sp. UC29_106 TaxID=3374553 RepID=UPI003756A1DD